MFIPLYDHNPRAHIRRQYVTWALIALNVAVFWVVEAGGAARAVNAAAVAHGAVPILFTAPTAETYASLVTYAFLHGDFWHLAGNMLFLWIFGDNVEDSLGHLRYLIFYLLCAAAGALVHVLMLPQSNVPVIGASGAVAGIVAAYLMLHPHARIWVLLGRILLRVPAYWFLGAWAVFQIYMVLQPVGETVAWWSHIGGMAAGAMLVLVMRRPGVRLFARRPSP